MSGARSKAIVRIGVLCGIFGCAGPPVEGPPDLVLISVDGLRADRLAAYGGPSGARAPTPRLNALAAGGLVVLDHHAGANESLFSHAVMLSGRPVSELAAPRYASFVLPEAALLLPEVLALYGYRSGAFVAGGHVRGAYGFDQGFEVYEDSADFGSFFHTVPLALDWLAEGPSGPRFTFLHGYDTHRPYLHAGPIYHAFEPDYSGPVDGWTDRGDTERIVNGAHHPDFVPDHLLHAAGDTLLDPGGYARLRAHAAVCPGVPLSAADQAHLLAHYDSGALAADLQVGRFIEALEASGRWAHTLVVITADHGEDLGDHGLYNHRSTLRDSTTRVPMILTGGALPAALRGQRLEGLSGAIDLVPTLLAAAGAAPPAGLRGLDLLAAAAGAGLPADRMIVQEGVLPQISGLLGPHRLVLEGVPLDSALLDLALEAAPLGGPHLQLYDRAADPAEQVEGSALQPEAAEDARAALLEWRRRLERSEAAGVQPQDPALQAILKARGYW